MDHRTLHAELLARRRGMAADAPGVMAGFARMTTAARAEGALEARVKELMALAIAVATGCAASITCQVHDALAAGATPEEVVEAVGVAVMMSGAPGVVYGGHALEAMEQFRGEDA